MNEQELINLHRDLMLEHPSDEETEALADRLANNPGDVATRLRIYVPLVRAAEEQSHYDARAMAPHILAFIRDAPFLLVTNSCGIVNAMDPEHRALRDAWDDALKKPNLSLRTLLNARRFYADYDFEREAVIIEALMNLAPGDREVLGAAGSHQLRGSQLGLPGCSAAKAYSLFAEASKVASFPSGVLAVAAFEAGLFEQARAAAEAALAAPKYGFYLHQNRGWSVLGRLALRDGKMAEAESCLASSAGGKLSEGGPSMSLARELCRAGRTESVAAFLAELPRIWPRHEAKIREWQEAFHCGRYDVLQNPGS